MKWEGKFRDKNNDAIYVLLVKGDENATKTLTFTDDPIEISYKSEDNIYKPIKASSATIRILTDKLDDNLYAISDREVKVEIYNLSRKEIIWAGYLTPNVYSQDYDEVKTELELECQDELSTLKSISTDNIPMMTTSIFEIIKYVLGVNDEDIIFHYNKDNMILWNTIYSYYIKDPNKPIYVEDKRVTDIKDYCDVLKNLSLNTLLFNYKESQDEDNDQTFFDILENIFTFFNMTLYEEMGKYHIVQYDNATYDTIDVSNDNTNCQISKTSTFKSFTYTHKPKCKTTEWNMIDEISGNKRELKKTITESDLTKYVRNNVELIEKVNSFYYVVGNSNTIIGNTDTTLDESGVKMNLVYKNKIPQKFTFYTHPSPFWDETLNLNPYWYDEIKSTAKEVDKSYGYLNYINTLGADFVALGRRGFQDEDVDELDTGLLIHQVIQDKLKNTRPSANEIDFMFFYRTNVESARDNYNTLCRTEIKDNWLGYSLRNSCCPVLSVDTGIIIDDMTHYISFDVEGKTIFNPELQINPRTDFNSKFYPKEMAKEFDANEKYPHYINYIKLPVELECGDYRYSAKFGRFVLKREVPFKRTDTYVLYLYTNARKKISAMGTVVYEISQKIYDSQGITVSTQYDNDTKGYGIQFKLEDGLKDVDNSQILFIDKPEEMHGNLKITLFSIPPVELFGQYSNLLADSNNYHYVALWLQGLFINKFKVQEHQTMENIYERVFDEKVDEDKEKVIALNSKAIEEFDDIECSIGNVDNFQRLLSKPLQTYYDYNTDDDGGIHLSQNFETDDPTSRYLDAIRYFPNAQININGAAKDIEEFTIGNIKNQYKDANIIIELKTHTKGDYSAMSHFYTYKSQFDNKKFIANEVSYDIKDCKTELKLQEKK